MCTYRIQTYENRNVEMAEAFACIRGKKYTAFSQIQTPGFRHFLLCFFSVVVRTLALRIVFFLS